MLDPTYGAKAFAAALAACDGRPTLFWVTFDARWLGDAGLLASDLPEEIARARKRLVDLASRGKVTKRLGFGARELFAMLGIFGIAWFNRRKRD